MSENPLSEYFKKPGIYVKLPSEANYYDEDINLSSTGEIEILPMSAKDEMHFKSPDALLNGESLIKVITNCVPGIKNPKEIPMPDLSVILIGLRVATYGNDMNVFASCPKCENRDELTYNIATLLDTVENITTKNTISINEALIHAKPYTLALHTRIAIATFEQTMLTSRLDSTLQSDEEAIKQLAEGYAKITALHFNLLADSIIKVELPDDVIVTDKEHIRDWITNTDKKTYDIMRDFIGTLNAEKVNNTIQHTCSKCKEEFPSDLDFDPTSFFG
jgi:hypothetical protein